MFYLKIPQPISQLFRLASKTSTHLQSHRYYRTNRPLLKEFSIWFSLLFYAKKYIKPTLAGFLSGTAVLVAAEKGLNFDLTLKFSPKGSLQNNLKAIVVSLLMCDSLTKDEVDLLQCIIDALPKEDTNNFNREKWCENEMTNFMKCTEKHGIRSETCCVYRTFLKSCLQAKSNCQRVQFSCIISSVQNEIAEKEKVVEICNAEIVETKTADDTEEEDLEEFEDSGCQCRCTCEIVVDDEDCEEEDESIEPQIIERSNYRKSKATQSPLSFLL